MVEKEIDRSRKRHPIQVVARRTGLSPDLLRAWEKRYGVVEPGRSEGGRRLYSDEDIERLRLLRRASRSGRRIGRIAALGSEALAELVREDEREEAEAEPEPRVGRTAAAERLFKASLAAVERLGGRELEAILNRALVTLSGPVVIEEVMAPLLREVGERWGRGELSPAHEHLASTVIARVLGRIIGAAEPPGDGPILAVATPAGLSHEFGAMFVAALAATAGWRVTYLGSDLPAEDIAMAARAAGADAVALSIVFVPDRPRLEEELKELRLRLPATVPILVGGSAAGSVQETLEEIDAMQLGSLNELRAALASLARH